MARTSGSIGHQTAARARQAALKLFAQKGYGAVSMRQIAGEIGLNAGALYNHFATKQALLAELMIAHMEALNSAWEANSRQFSDPITALEGFVRFHIGYHLDRRDEVFIAYMELRSLETENFGKVEGLRKYYEGYLRKILQAGHDNGVFKLADVAVSAMAIIAMLTGVTHWFRSAGRFSADEIEMLYVHMVLGMVGLDSQGVVKSALPGQKSGHIQLA